MPESSTQTETSPTEERLALYIACERAILMGHQSHTVDGVTYTRADLRAVQLKIKELEAALNPSSFNFTQHPVTFV